MTIDRRTLLHWIAGALAMPSVSWAASTGAKGICLVAVGADLVRHAVDEATGELKREAVVRVPEAVQYIWFHPTRPLLYAAFSNRYTSKSNDRHGVQAYAISPGTGDLTPFGPPLMLTNRPVHITLDPAAKHLLVAYNLPAALTVHRLGTDGTILDEVKQKEPIEPGIYAHQVRVSPAGDLVVLSTRGNDATPKAPEDPGAFKVFRFADGQLSHEASLTKGSGLGFGPRHVDFHPEKPWMFASMERNNQLLVYRVEAGGLSATPIFEKETVDRPERKLPVQFVGPIHLHPNGKFVYLANRSDGTVDFAGAKVHGDGENTIAVFTVDPATGEPTLVQRIETQTFHVRTFTIHPNGKLLVAASVAPLAVRDGDQVRTAPAGLTVFRIGDDGKLTFVRKYDVDVGSDWMFWCGMTLV